MATWYDVGFDYLRDKVSKETIAKLEKTFKSFDYDFPSLNDETAWRGPQCSLQDVLNFCTFFTGEPFKGWLRRQEAWDRGYGYQGPPSPEKWTVGVPALGNHREMQEIVLNYIFVTLNENEYLSNDEYELMQKMIATCFGEKVKDGIAKFASLLEGGNGIHCSYEITEHLREILYG
jgi:hypothetical protein